MEDGNPFGVMLSKLAQAQLDRDTAIKRAESAEQENKRLLGIIADAHAKLMPAKVHMQDSGMWTNAAGKQTDAALWIDTVLNLTKSTPEQTQRS